MAKKKSNTGMIIAIIVSVIVVGIVVWGFLTKWKFIDDGKSTEKAKAKKEVQKKNRSNYEHPNRHESCRNYSKNGRKIEKNSTKR